MAVYVIGTLYNPLQSGIAWSQPGGPGTQVFPAEQINVPFAAYPTQGQLWAENSGTPPGGPAGCGHWMNLPMIFFDGDGFIATLIYLQDNLGRNWHITVSDDGTQIIVLPIGNPVDGGVVLLSDQSIAQTWMLTLIANGSTVDIEITPVGGSGGQEQLLVVAANGDAYAIQVSNGVLQTAYPEASMGGPIALVTCNLCSYIQYAIPQAQFYNSFTSPVTFI